MATLTSLFVILISTCALIAVGYRLNLAANPHPENSTVNAHFAIELYALAAFVLCGIIGTHCAIVLGY